MLCQIISYHIIVITLLLSLLSYVMFCYVLSFIIPYQINNFILYHIIVLYYIMLFYTILLLLTKALRPNTWGRMSMINPSFYSSIDIYVSV